MALTFFASTDLDQTVSSVSMNAVIFGAVALILLVSLMLLWAHKHPRAKVPLFSAIALIIIGVTLTISGGTVYLNLNSATGGPVHWHADTEFWACGNELELRDPTGLSNRIGTPTLHEHNDKRIHLEGVPISLPQDASLSKFMHVIGGKLTSDTLQVPLNPDKYFENGLGEEDGDGNGAPNPEAIDPYITTTDSGKVATFTHGGTCNGQPAEVQVFVYQYNAAAHTYHQTKLNNPALYAISPQSEVPSGDCVIFEYGPVANHTTHLCKQYGIRNTIRCHDFGIPAAKQSTCNVREVQ